MIKPGTQICNICGRTSAGLFYGTGESAERVARLIWDPNAKVFSLVPAKEGDKTFFTLQDPDSIHQNEHLPSSINARIGSAANHTALKRCCPHCGTPFTCDLIGLVPCYIIAVMGAPNAGKTSYLGALATAALGPVSQQKKYPYCILPVEIAHTVEGIGATPLGASESNKTNFFQIIDKESKEVAALVYLLDYGGELYSKKYSEKDTPVNRFLFADCGKGYTGIDALIVIEPSVSTEKMRAASENLLPILSNIRGAEGQDYPIAHVMTFGDHLILQESRKPLNDPEPPLLTAKTFPATVYTKDAAQSLVRHFTPEAIADRFHLQQFIARKILHDKPLGLQLAYYHGNQTRHFIVRSCDQVVSDIAHNDYTKQFNVVDPFIWLLRELKLFPLGSENGG